MPNNIDFEPVTEYGTQDLYRALAQAETGSFQDPWIRTTHAPKQGSTAFGPVQITRTLAKSYADKKLLSPESEQFYRTVMEPMYQNFNKYGREPHKPGYDPAFDYGGKGYFDAEAYGESYNRMAEEMIQNEFKEAGGDVNKFIRRWRGTSDDARYNRAVKKGLGLMSALNPFVASEAHAADTPTSFDGIDFEPIEQPVKSAQPFSFDGIDFEPVDPGEAKIASLGGEIAKGVGRGWSGVIAGTGDLMSYFGERLPDESGISETVKEGVGRVNPSLGTALTVADQMKKDERVKSVLKKIGDKMQSFGDENSEFWRKASEKALLAPDPKLFRGTFMENPSWTRAFAIIAEAVPSLGAATAVTFVTKSPTAGALMLGATEGASQAREAKEAGKDKAAVDKVMAASTIGNTILERIPLDFMLKGGVGKGLLARGSRAAAQGGVEAAQEATQTVWQNLIAKVGYDRTRQLHEGIVESLIAGAGSGGLMGSFTPGTAQKLDEAIAEAVEDGVLPEEIEQAAQEATNVLVENSEEIDQIITQNVAQTQATEVTEEATEAQPDPNGFADEDKKDIENLLDFETNMPGGERLSFVDNEGNRQFIGVKSGHSQTMQSIGPKAAMDLLSRAQAGEKLAPGQMEKVQQLLEDYRKNTKASLESAVEQIAVPEFKNTEGALEFGLRNKDNPVILKRLQAERDKILAQTDALHNLEDPTDEQLQEAMNLAVKGQFYREALEVAAGEIDPAFLEKIKLNITETDNARRELTESEAKEVLEIVESQEGDVEFDWEGNPWTEADVQRLISEGKSAEIPDEIKPAFPALFPASPESRVTRSGQIRPELQAPIPKELFQEKGELFAEKPADKKQSSMPIIDQLEADRKELDRLKALYKKMIDGDNSDMELVLETKDDIDRLELIIKERAEDLEETVKRIGKPFADKKKKGGGGSGAASVGQFTEEFETETATFELKPVESIEMLRMAKELMGQYPKIKKYPSARGIFYPEGKGAIGLTPSLFERGNEKQLAATLAHEIGHLIDYIPEGTLKRGNLLGRLLTLQRFMKNTFQGDLGKQLPGLNISSRKIKEEMKALSFEWRPFDEANATGAFKAYRNSAVEIYADFVSAVLNNPGYVQQKAPNAFKIFFDNLDRKLEVKKQYFAMQELLNGKPEEMIKARQEDIRRMFAKGEAMREQMEAEKNLAKVNMLARVRQLLDDKHFPAIDRLRKQEAGGVIPRNNLAHVLQEWDLSDNTNYLMMGEIDEKVMAPIQAKGLTIEDLGEVTFLKRVVGRTGNMTEAQKKEMVDQLGYDEIEERHLMELIKQNSDREDIANPLGFAPEAAQKQLDFLKDQLGADKFQTLEESAQAFHDIIFKSIEEAVEVGSYNQQTFEKVIKPNKDYYVSFGVLNYLQDYVPSGIKAQKGTLSEIENPIITTILKTVSLNRFNARQKATKTFVESWKEMFPDEIEPARVRRVDGRPVGFVPDRKKGTVQYFENGKPAAYYVDPYIARSFESSPPMVFEAAALLNKALGNKHFKDLVITYNLGFSLAFNPIRDFKRSYMNLNAMGHKITIGGLIAEYAKNLPRTIQRQKGINDERIKEMMANKALDIPFIDYNFDIRNDSFGRMLKKFRVGSEDEPKPKTVRYTLVRGVMRVLEGVRFVGAVTESISKVAAYNHLKEKGVDDKERAWITRNYVGTPNFRTKGELTDVTNQVFIFSNIMKEALKADLTLATNPTTRGGWWLANFKVNIFPKLLMVAGAIGLAGDDLEEWFEKVPEYDKANYVIVPLGTKEDGRAVYARVPHDETSRFFAAILWKVMTISQNKEAAWKDIFAVGAGNIPGVAPAISIAGGWTQFLSGKNPYDDFRGRYVVPDRVFDAGGFPALKKMVQWSFNSAGFSQFTTYDDRRDSTFEAVLKGTPGLNAVTRILKVSDYGRTEAMYDLNEQARKESARTTLARRQAFEKYLKGYGVKDLDRIFDEGAEIRDNDVNNKLKQVAAEVYGADYDKDDMRNLRKDFLKYVMREQNNPYARAITGAPTNAVKIKILKEAKENMPRDQHDVFVSKLRRAKIISKDVIRELSQP